MPGGFVEEGETFRDGALRELREETGLIGGDLRLFYRRVFQHPLRHWQEVSERNYFVDCPRDSPIVIDPKEHIEYRWITVVDAERLSTWERKREAIYRAFQAQRLHANRLHSANKSPGVRARNTGGAPRRLR